MWETMLALSSLFVFMHLLKPWAANNAQEEEESHMHAFYFLLFSRIIC